MAHPSRNRSAKASTTISRWCALLEKARSLLIAGHGMSQGQSGLRSLAGSVIEAGTLLLHALVAGTGLDRDLVNPQISGRYTN